MMIIMSALPILLNHALRHETLVSLSHRICSIVWKVLLSYGLPIETFPTSAYELCIHLKRPCISFILIVTFVIGGEFPVEEMRAVKAEWPLTEIGPQNDFRTAPADPNGWVERIL